MKAQTSSRRQRGFNLLEVLIAVVILSIGLLALASLQISLVRSSAEAKTQTIAMALAKEKIEKLREFSTPAAYTALADFGPQTVNDSGGNQGGVNFTWQQYVTRYVWDTTSQAFEYRASDTESDSALQAVSGNTYQPGKEFKRVRVTVSWTDAAGGAQMVAMEDAIGNIDPSKTLDLLAASSSSAPRQAIVVRENPGDIAGVIPIAIGNGTSTAATNPTPEINTSNQGGSKLVETRFEVLTYAGINGNADDELVETQSRVETAVVTCQCDYSTAPAANTNTYGYRPTYWSGYRYAAPERASYKVPAGEQSLPNNSIPQSEKCAVCCRDHHDPGTDTVKFSPRRSSHTHYSISGSTLTATTTGPYWEVCRLIRVDGIFRVAADVYNDRENLVATANSGDTPYPGSGDGEGEDQYADFVLDYLDARIVNNDTPSTFNTKLRVRSGADSAAQTVIDNAITALEDAAHLNDPALLEIDKASDSKWLHSRGLYIDYLETDARDAIVAAYDACKGTDDNAADSTEEFEACVLPLMPFTSINTSELAYWSVSNSTWLNVTNADFKTVQDANGSTDPVKGYVTPTANATQNDSPHPWSTSTVMDGNSGLASRDLAVHNDEINIADKQTFDILPGGSSGTSLGAITSEIAAASGVLPTYLSGQEPKLFFFAKYSNQTQYTGCTAVSPSSTPGYPNPYTCNDALVGGSGKGQAQSYNYSPVDKKTWVGTATCTKSNGTGAISVSMNRSDRPYCRNYDVTAALWRSGVLQQTGLNKSETNDGYSNEYSTFDFTNVQNGDNIIYTFTDETPNPYTTVTNSDYTCFYNGNAASQNQSTVTFTWVAQCKTAP